MRELRKDAKAYIMDGGITPACARTTTKIHALYSKKEDHPRVCENYDVPDGMAMLAEGSPPRVRELHDNVTSYRYCLRITPACAGITQGGRLGELSARDHPRVCGNYALAVRSPRSLLGSPPRVRELLKLRPIAKTAIRITPACAGITQAVKFWRWHRGDHPRVCGNYAKCCFPG